MRDLDLHAVHAAVAGGSVLAAGGGGWVDHGLLVGTTAVQYGTPRLATLDEVDPDAMLATVSAIGAPAAVGWEMRPGDYVRALQLLIEAVPEPIVGTVTAQNGSSTTCNGWVASAVLGTLVIDAAGDGRAHPTGKMGSFGLAADDDYQTVQAVAGGNRAEDRYLEVVTRGTVRHTANVLRTAAEQSGGFISCARNPLPASFVAQHAAVGAISFALALGEAILAVDNDGPRRMIEVTAEHLGGALIAEGAVRSRVLRTENAFDIGTIVVGELELGFVNEYLTAESAGERLATFPDVIATLSLQTGRIISIANLREGDEVAVLHVPKANVPLGDGVKRAERLPGGRDDARKAARAVRAWLTAIGSPRACRRCGRSRTARPAAPTARRSRPPRRRRCCWSRAGRARPGSSPGSTSTATSGRCRPALTGVATSGSHVDTVPDGGRYDGALGTVLGLELAHEIRSPACSGLRRRGGAPVRRRHGRLAAAGRHAGGQRPGLAGRRVGNDRGAGPRRVPGGARRAPARATGGCARPRARRDPRRSATGAARARRRHAGRVSPPPGGDDQRPLRPLGRGLDGRAPRRARRGGRGRCWRSRPPPAPNRLRRSRPSGRSRSHPARSA